MCIERDSAGPSYVYITRGDFLQFVLLFVHLPRRRTRRRERTGIIAGWGVGSGFRRRVIATRIHDELRKNKRNGPIVIRIYGRRKSVACFQTIEIILLSSLFFRSTRPPPPRFLNAATVSLVLSATYTYSGTNGADPTPVINFVRLMRVTSAVYASNKNIFISYTYTPV